MSYLLDLVQDFIVTEMKNNQGFFIEDMEYSYATGMVLKLLIDRRKFTKKKAELFLERIFHHKNMDLLKQEIDYLLKDMNLAVYSPMEQNLIRMIVNYSPEHRDMESTWEEAIREGFLWVWKKNLYERQERYQEREGLISKSYKLNRQIVEDFAKACEKKKVRLGPQLMELMQEFIDSVENES